MVVYLCLVKIAQPGLINRLHEMFSLDLRGETVVTAKLGFRLGLGRN